MITVITGAAGFIGRSVVRRLQETGYDRPVRLIDKISPESPGGNFESVAIDLTERAQLKSALEGADRVIHLAALPGGAAEADPTASRRINLEGPLDLLDEIGRAPRKVRFVFASTIAVLGTPQGPAVHDDSPMHPAMTYGTHKLMVEYALIDATRRGLIDGLALRLPGIVARPPGGGGLKSAFMSDIFRAIAIPSGPFEIPVAPEASIWLLSAQACADALIHGAKIEIPATLPRAITIPALHLNMRALVRAIVDATGRDASHLRYVPDASMTKLFGQMPPLTTRAADAMGFAHDGSIENLVQIVMKTLNA